jgi:hypothetical protein
MYLLPSLIVLYVVPLVILIPWSFGIYKKPVECFLAEYTVSLKGSTSQFQMSRLNHEYYVTIRECSKDDCVILSLVTPECTFSSIPTQNDIDLCVGPFVNTTCWSYGNGISLKRPDAVGIVVTFLIYVPMGFIFYVFVYLDYQRRHSNIH